MDGSYISYLAPLIITGITGISLTSIAFNRIVKSIEDSVRKFKEISNLGITAPPISYFEDLKNFKLRKFANFEYTVIISFCLSEIFVIYPFFSAVSYDLLKSVFLPNGISAYFILFSYLAMLAGFFLSVYVYGCAIHYNKKMLPPPLYEENDERRKSRENLLRAG